MISDRLPIIAVATLGTITISVFVVKISEDQGPLAALSLLLVVTLALAATQVPTHWLPSIALAFFALVPPRTIPENIVTKILAPATLIMLFWAVRMILSTQKRTRQMKNGQISLQLFAFAFIVWCVALTYISPFRNAGLTWTISFVAGALVVIFVDCVPSRRSLIRTWSYLGCGLSIYAVIESLFEKNVIFGTLRESRGLPSVQHWSEYRADASFGHPLFAGTFLAVAFGITLASWVETHDKKMLYLSLINIAGVLSTLSRGAIAACAAAAAVIVLMLLFVRLQNQLQKVSLIILAGACVVTIATSVDRFSARWNSVEAGRSTDARTVGTEVAYRTADFYNYLGAGPGSSQQAVVPFNPNELPIENSFQQLLVSVGIPGLVIIVLLIGSVLMYCIRCRNMIGIAALVAYLVAVYGYNAIDARTSMHVLLGAILILCATNRMPDGKVAGSEMDGPVEDVAIFRTSNSLAMKR